ncbi:MAG TPA: aminoacyl-tRNA hydrolase [Acidimicrobiia bacterium]|nr:aminoacyl-tRNA hydrolase [Acidimicrobiia bacterium]
MEFLVIGLGNPGKEYERTRHNVGFTVVDILCSRFGASLSKETPASIAATITIGGHKVLLAQPTTYMNDSGIAVGEIVRRYKVDADRIIVVHDELDLEFGSVRLKVGGGLAGHNGLRSIKQHLKTQDFIRVRIGVDKPTHKSGGASHVLKPMSKKELEIVDGACERAADAVEMMITESVDAAMRVFHTS